ncbi:hypothetical protein [Solibacillus daqui]
MVTVRPSGTEPKCK